MNNTLFLLVTCTKEKTRYDILKEVVSNISSITDEKLLSNFLVFDNASTYPGSVQLLTDTFKNVFQSEINVGYWSALSWCFDHYKSIMQRDYEYVYIIESDLIHTKDAFKKLNECEVYLDNNPNIGFIRTEEFLVSERHFYDKRNRCNGSKTYAWCVQDNFLEGKRVEFTQSDQFSYIYDCNFLAKLPAFHRVDAIKQVFSKLSNMEKISEIDFQKFYYELYKKSSIIDGGIFHSKLSNENPTVINGSHNFSANIDYRSTRNDSIVKNITNKVKKI